MDEVLTKISLVAGIPTDMFSMDNRCWFSSIQDLHVWRLRHEKTEQLIRSSGRRMRGGYLSKMQAKDVAID